MRWTSFSRLFWKPIFHELCQSTEDIDRIVESRLLQSTINKLSAIVFFFFCAQSDFTYSFIILGCMLNEGICQFELPNNIRLPNWINEFLISSQSQHFHTFRSMSMPILSTAIYKFAQCRSLSRWVYKYGVYSRIVCVIWFLHYIFSPISIDQYHCSAQITNRCARAFCRVECIVAHSTLTHIAYDRHVAVVFILIFHIFHILSNGTYISLCSHIGPIYAYAYRYICDILNCSIFATMQCCKRKTRNQPNRLTMVKKVEATKNHKITRAHHRMVMMIPTWAEQRNYIITCWYKLCGHRLSLGLCECRRQTNKITDKN